jgi:hypothetical protein
MVGCIYILYRRVGSQCERGTKGKKIRIKSQKVGDFITHCRDFFRLHFGMRDVISENP